MIGQYIVYNQEDNEGVFSRRRVFHEFIFHKTCRVCLTIYNLYPIKMTDGIISVVSLLRNGFVSAIKFFVPGFILM